jgi:multidrug transporter EmrE-like cation transporter
MTQFPWYAALKERNHLAIMATIWCLAGLVGAVILGRFVFNEALTTQQWIGIGLSFIACLLLC